MLSSGSEQYPSERCVCRFVSLRARWILFPRDRKLKRYGTSFPIRSLPCAGGGGGGGNGVWRAVTAAEGGGDKSEEDGTSRLVNLVPVTNHPTRKRPAIHFLISIPQPPPWFIRSSWLQLIPRYLHSRSTISHPIYIRVEYSLPTRNFQNNYILSSYRA